MAQEAVVSELDKHYTNHLSEVNTTKTVTTTDDVRNEQGALIMPEGMALDKTAAEKILQHTLEKSLDLVVAIKNKLDGRQLLKTILDSVHADKACLAVHNSIIIEEELKEQCINYNAYPLLVQKMTVMSLRLPVEFLAATTAAYVGLAIAIKMKLSEDSKKTIFLAGLAQNIGYLYLSPELVNKRYDHTEEELKVLQQHPILGSRILSGIPRMPEGVIKVVLEHHERLDGSGYPRGLQGQQLTIESQMIAFVDAMFTVYRTRLIKLGYSIGEMAAVMRVNTSSHFQGVYESAIKMLRDAELPDDRKVADVDIPGLIQQLIAENSYFYNRFKIAQPLLKVLPRDSSYQYINVAYAMFDRIFKAASNNGLATLEYRTWLESVLQSESMEDAMEIERAALMHAEFSQHLNELDQMMVKVVDNHGYMGKELLASIKDWTVQNNALKEAVSS